MSGAAPALGGGPAEARLMPLREDLSLLPGPRAPGGSPTWTLFDPVANRFYRIGWLEFEILARWHLGTASAVEAAIAAETTLRTTAAQIEEFLKFLARSCLLEARGEQAIARLKQMAAAGRKGWLMWAVKNYLFLRIPLVAPDGFLTRSYPRIAWLYSRWVLWLLVGAGVVGLTLVARVWDEFLATFPLVGTPEGAAMFAVVLATTKLLHELGHAYTAKRYGCKVPSMGIALLVLWPVLYTDCNDAWRLVDRRRRLAIAAGGMTVELALAVLATLAWTMFSDGALRSAAFMLATVTWVMTLAVNLNPLMRFDGYFLLSDLLDVPNLQERAFSLARWRLRELLFGFGDPPPEPLMERLRRSMLVYAYATWVYRLILFLGIALMVYHLFFKVLGIVLFLVEIWWFILRPVVHELRHWVMRKRRAGVTRNMLVTGALLSVGLGLALLPLPHTVLAPGVLRAEKHVKLFTPQPARLSALNVGPGERVTARQPLFVFDAPDLLHDLAQVDARIATLRWQTEVQLLNRDLAIRTQVVWSELAQAEAKQQALRDQVAKLTVPAPFDGVVVDRLDPLAVGDWLTERVELGTLIDDRTSVVEAYVDEADLRRIAVGGPARFLPDDIHRPPFAVTVTAVDRANTTALTVPYLASTHGGTIPVRHDARTNSLVSESPIYRVLLQPEGPLPAPAQVVRGELRLEASSESLAVRLFRSSVALVIRESGF